MKTFLFFVALSGSVASFAQKKLTDKVDVFLGTGGHGHVYPGATVPFGMVQLSPDNGKQGWDWCSGYHYSSDTIAGFSHTHLSGTGIGDWCDISVMPFNHKEEKKHASAFSHKNESGRPGYYKVKLNNGILCEMTASERIGIHRYSFPDKTGYISFDLGFQINWDATTQTSLQLLNDTTLVGYRFSTGWAKNQRVFFAATFSSPITSQQIIDTKVATLEFKTNNSVTVKLALSSVSEFKALSILKNYSLSFDATRKAADEAWEKELQKITVHATPAFENKFYTALYRTCLAPVLYSDEDGTYRNQDNTLHTAIGKKYTVYSLWDTFRALNPLFTITQNKRLPDLINSMLSFYDDNGLLPVWDLSTWETNTMTGYHSVPVIADAILKDVKGFDYSKAYHAMLKSANQLQRGTAAYNRFGYVPQDKHGWSVTITLEYAFDDWCIAQVAKKLGKENDYNVFIDRSKRYRNLFDKQTGFMRAKDSTGKFIEPFDPLLSEHGFDGQYIEGTAWQHSFFVPHDVNGLADLYGGKEMLVKKLDELFASESVLHGENTSADVTGLIGQYAHGNEPSHHIIYMYSALGENKKAADKIRLVVDSMYKAGPDGLIGNDDCGQMSAWLVWSSLGMYPMNPASGEYVFGVPLVQSGIIQLPDGKKLKIECKGKFQNGSIRKAMLNGKPLSASIKHSDLLKGGKLIYYMN